jgi:hypothetical protein
VTRLEADTVIDGRYQVIEHLGTGGMADRQCRQRPDHEQSGGDEDPDATHCVTRRG